MTIREEIQLLDGSTIVELFEIDTTRSPSGGVFRFHAGTSEVSTTIVWAGNSYFPLPIKCDGFEMKSEGALPRPLVTISNVDGIISSLANDGLGLLGCEVTRIRTLARFLDAGNFSAGNPLADPSQEFPREVWLIDRKASENRETISFELCVPYDVMGQRLPARQIIKNSCVWTYRSAECGYSGSPVADSYDAATIDPSLDKCSRHISGCRLRFGAHNQLPFGGYPASS